VVSLKWSVVVVDVILGISHTAPAPCENFVRESCADVISADDAVVLMLQSIQCYSLSSVGGSCLKDTRPFSDRLYRERMVRELVQVCDLYTHKLLKTALSVKSSCFFGLY